MKPSRKLDKAHTNLALEHCNTGLQLDKAKARIAELAAEVARAKGLVEMAYREGFVDGRDLDREDETPTDKYWATSRSRNALKEGL